MSRFKRCISLLLVLGILLGVLAPAAQAAPVEETATVNADNVTIEGTNGFGDLLAQEVAENQQETETQSKDYPGGYSVTDLQIVDNVATVTYDTMEEATLVVALYTEDGMQLLTSAKATVTPENTEASVTFEDEIPEYFMASAYLMDSYDLSPLCAAYDTPMYTRQMQELLASTVDDYDPEKVLNLDDDDTTNFAVYADSTIVIEPEDGVNTVASIDDENAVYVIKNADEQITALREGDVFVYSYAEGEMLIVKVETITINGTTATITGSELELEEVFSHMKIENTGSTEDMIVDENSGDEGVTYIGLQPEDAVNPSAKEGDAELQFSMGFDVEKEIDRYSSFSGSLGVQLNIEFEYYISLKRQFIRLEYGYEVATKIAYQFQAGAPIPKATAKLELKSFGYMPLPYVLIGFEPEVVVEFTATVEVSCTLSGSGGFAFEGGKGVDDLTRKPTVDVDIKFEGVIFFGIDLGPHISILKDKIAKIKLSSQVGLELTGKSTGSLFEDIVLNGELPKEKHECELCIAVDLAIKADFSVKIELLKCDWLTWEFKLAAKAFKIGACYYSETYSDFGFGTCPHKLYRVTVVVTDTESQRASGVQVAIGDLKGDTAENGVICFYLPEGTYTIEATDGTLTRSKKITLNAAQKVTVSLSDDPDNHILDQAGMDISIDHSMTARGEFGGNQYQLFDVSMTWPEAKAYCESLGGHLATITSAEEQAYIESLMEAGGKKQYWIGMQYIDRDYRWITGEPVVYTNWDWRMPDGSSYNDLREDYVHILNQPNPASANSKRFHWNDMYYDNIFRNANELDFFNTCYVGFICELESEQPTEVTVFTNNEPDYRVHAVYPGDYGTEITDTYTLKTAGFKNLVPGEQYVLLAMAGIAVEDPLAADNLLFIDQAAASEDGTLAFEYVQRTPCDISYVVACGASNKNLNDAEITFPEMTADGELQVVDPVVVYDGKTLTEGRDYIVLDKVDFTGAGEYVCFIRGIHNYTGLVECPYIVTGDDYIISYNANGGNGAPVSQTKEPGVPLTISSVVPTRFGYTFLGWATSSNATAASYLPGGSFTINADTVLYAVWQSVGTIPANVTSSSFSASIPFSDGCQYFAFTPSFTGKVQFESTGTGDPRLYIYDSGGNKIAYNDDSGEGYNFLLTFPVTSGTKYYAMVKFYSSGMGTVNFTVKRAYDIVYDANGGSGAPSTQTKIHGTALTLSSDIPTRAGYTFLGWSTNSSAAAAVYQPGSSFSSNADTTLYAVWGNGVSETYTITYNANGGYGAPDPQNVPSGEVRRISSIVPNRFPYSFLGWSTSSAATSVTYLPGDLITITRDITLYAVWEEACSISPNVTNVSHDVMIPFAEGDKFYKFTPGTSMKCIFESSADDMTQIVLFNEEGAMLTLDYGTLSDLNFSLQYDVTAGTTYYLSVGYLGFGHGTFSFKVSRAYDITYDANGGTDAPASQIAKHDTPLMLSSAVPNRFGYTFLGWSADSSDAYADFLPGDSFTTDADVTLYAIWREATPIMSREHTAVTRSTARITFADGYHFYKIVPTFTGKVQVESSGADDPVIYLYDAQANQLAWDDDSGEGNNFKLTHSLTIATTYYVKVKYNSSHTGTISLMMSRAFDVTYDANGGSGAPEVSFMWLTRYFI